MEANDTICAISTPPGEGGIGVIRMSGPLAHTLLRGIFKPRTRKKRFASRRLYLGHIINPQTKERIDEVFAVFMAAPATYTRENISEVYSHGGVAAQRTILTIMMDQGARLAGPGEFTKRAFLNGRIDLLQAEAVLDIIHSETEEELRFALEHLKGRLSEKLNTFQETVRGMLAEVEALIDFPEDEVRINEKDILRELHRAKTGMGKLVSSYYAGNAFKEGFEVLIVGRTNVGKSSLLNALVAKERAIVTPLPGTTRDLIEDTLHIRGIKVKIIDTAGIRMPLDVAEEAGIELVRQKIPYADLVLWVLDGSVPYTTEDEKLYESFHGKRCIVVINKIDLPWGLRRNVLLSRGLMHVEVSALTEEGIDLLRDAVYEIFMGKGLKPGKLLITSLRHRDALLKAKGAIEGAIASVMHRNPLEFTAFELREALHYLGHITGETCPEEILHDIFERFCIGK